MSFIPIGAPRFKAPGFNKKLIPMSSKADEDIQLNFSNARSYKKCDSYNPQDYLPATWHQITLEHRRKYSKADIIDGIFNIVEDCEFFPVAYTEFKVFDVFLVKDCLRAIDQIFRNKLLLRMNDGGICQIFVTFNVGESKFGHISGEKKLTIACINKLQSLESHNGINMIMNLERLKDHSDFRDVIVNISNVAVLKVLLRCLNNTLEICQKIHGIKLSFNSISKLTPFKLLTKPVIVYLDLSYNNITNIDELDSLAHLQLTELYLTGNPITKTPEYIGQVKSKLSCLKLIDGVSLPSETIPMQISNPNPMRIENNVHEIDSQTLADGLHFKMYKGSEQWHRIIILHGGKYSKQDILKALNDLITIEAFYPCYYTIGQFEDSFLVRDSFPQMEVLTRVNLKLPMVKEGDHIPIKFKMNVCKAKQLDVVPPVLIAKAIDSRYNIQNQVLDLSDFQSCKLFKDMEVWMSNPKVLNYVLMLANRRLTNKISSLILSRNSISLGKNLHHIFQMKSLRVFDISYNNIEHITELNMLPKTNIQEVLVQGNPLCTRFDSPMQYIKILIQIFPALRKLDGEFISLDLNFVIQRNYLCRLEGYDFVHQFIIQYFKAFDTFPNQRELLREYYHEKAICTMSSNLVLSRLTEIMVKCPQVEKYRSCNRNVLKMTHHLMNVHVGFDQIYSYFRKIGKTEHLFDSFQVDTTILTPKMIQLTVQGIYREFTENVMYADLYMSFSRTFILKPMRKEIGLFQNSVQFKIINDIIHVTLLSPIQKSLLTTLSNSVTDPMDEELSKQDKDGLIVEFQQLTNLNTEKCVRMLSSTNWNFSNALAAFIDLYSEDKIPPYSFRTTAQ